MVKLKLVVLLLFAVGTAALLLTENAANPHARAYSAGPPAGFTRAPGELDCSDCHTAPAQSSGTLALSAPQKYTPGQTYDITVTHATADPTRVRWGFELTALDAADQKAGTLAPSDDLTQVVNNQGPFPSRQYAEHTQKGSFPGRQNGAAWTFRWTAPAEDVGAVTFYVAGNQANGDGNSSGDNIYFTSASSSFQPPAPDFQLTVTPSARTLTQGGAAVTYDVTVTPLHGFTGQVALSLAGLPTNAVANFQPATIQVNDSAPQTSVLSVSGPAATPTGTSTLEITATAGQLARTVQATLNVVGAGDADVSLGQTVSPNPGQAGADLKFTFTVSNNGPAAATSTTLKVLLPSTVSNFTAGAGACALVPRAGQVEVSCSLGNLGAGQSAAADFTVRPASPGTLEVTATATASEHDPFPANNTTSAAVPVAAVAAGPSMTVPGLGVRTVVSGLSQPTSLAFVGADDFLVLEKASGRVVRVKGGAAQGSVLDLAVNSASERGLLGIALHPDFAANGFAYLYWTESASGADATAVDDVPLLGNRVDRFVWDGARLTFDRTLIRLRAQQTDAGQPARGNHNGGVLRFGPDGKLYVFVGDEGRRGLLQNLPCGPTVNCPGPAVPDDQAGGPEPDDAHLSGVILRLNDDGTTPADNPFFHAQTGLTGQAAANVRKVFAYGLRNGFGMDFDPFGDALWTQENGDDAFDEINRVEAGFNGGWSQLMGPSARVAEFKAIEVARGNSLQQNRWPPSNIADTPAQALARLYSLPGSHYEEPEFSWKYAVAPSPIGFARGGGLGLRNDGHLFVGASRTTLLGGYLMRFELSPERRHVEPTDARLADRVADNADKFDLAESESLVVGRDFGITTDIRSEPSKGTLYVVSLSNGAVYEVYGVPTLYVANLDGGQEVPPTDSKQVATATIMLDRNETTAHVSLTSPFLIYAPEGVHIHGPAAPGQTGELLFNLPKGNFRNHQINLTPEQVGYLKAGLLYIHVHTPPYPGGEMRGQFGATPAAAPSVIQFDEAEVNYSEGPGAANLRVVRMGDTSEAASVDYSTSDGTASERSDYTTTRGTLRFAPGETEKTVTVLLGGDGLVEPRESFKLTLSGVSGPAVLGKYAALTVSILDDEFAGPKPNPIDDTQFFVRQHYHDFLNREPDDEGLAFWTQDIEQCGTDSQCREVKRVNVSAAFFLSIEFQETGYLVYRLYQESFGRQPRYEEFIPDVQEIGRGVVVGRGEWRALLEANRRGFAEAWAARAAFRSLYDGLSNAAYVEQLYRNAGIPAGAGERETLVAALEQGSRTRGGVLLDVADTAAFRQKEFTRAFVLMQYFGYLRRNPEDPPDSDRGGYDFWLEKLNGFGGDYIRAEMVKAFINSIEYRRRFGQP